jgi:hypothetical protein
MSARPSHNRGLPQYDPVEIAVLLLGAVLITLTAIAF